MKKIVVVAESIDVNDSSGTKGRVALINNMVKIGYDVYVYHYTRKNIQIQGAKCIAIREIKFSWNYFFSRLERQLRYKLKIDLHKIFEKIWGFSFTLFNDRDSIIKAIKNIDFDPDLVFTFSKGGSFRPHHAILKMPEYHDKWVAYIHDPYPMHLYPRPYNWVEPGYKKKYHFVKELCNSAYKLAFPSELLMEWMDSYFHNCISKGVIIPHQIYESNYSMPSDFPIYFDTKKFNILHSGNLLWGRDPRGLIDGFKLFLSNNPSAKNESKLILLGGTNYYSKYLSLEENNVSQIFVSKDYLNHSEVLEMQYNTNVNIILEAKSEISPFLPGKFPHCIAANKPVLLLGPFYSECRRLLGDSYEYYAEIDQSEKISSLLEKLYWRWKQNKFFSLDRQDLKYYLSEKKLAKTLNKIILKK